MTKPKKMDANVLATLSKAAEQIKELKDKSIYILIRRARGKSHRLSPTAYQGILLRYIEANGPFSFHQTLGMDWRFLGGLLARGLLTWVNMADGTVALVPARKEK